MTDLSRLVRPPPSVRKARPMSDDLVKRLRTPTGLNAFTREPVCDRLRVEAADRIETLEAALARTEANRDAILDDLHETKTALAAMTAERDGYRDICDPWAFGSADPSEIGG